MAVVEIAGRPVGGDHPPMFWPDIDLYFNGDLEEARRTLRTLRDAKVEIIKGAIIQRADLFLDDGTEETYYSRTKGVIRENKRAIIERRIVPLSGIESLFRICRDEGMDFILSVYDREAADFARDIGAAAIKLASSNLTNDPLILHVARLGLPVVLDTGKSTLEEIAHAVQTARDAGIGQLILQHSPDAPPAPLANHHLRMLQSLATLFQTPIGLSDHHDGVEMMYAAVALGAHVLEKGIFADDTPAPDDQDIAHAMPVSQVAATVATCRRIWEALGSPMRQLPRERNLPVSRRCLAARTDLAAGAALRLSDIDMVSPVRGIPVEQWALVEGWTLRRDIPCGQVIRWSDVIPAD